jgi:site-specific recombinase XerD
MTTRYLTKGGVPICVRELLGCERIETTQIYVGLAKKVQRLHGAEGEEEFGAMQARAGGTA